MRNKSFRALVIGFSIFLFSGGAYAALVKENIGLYGGYVADVEAYDRSGTTEILIAVDTSQGGIFRYSTPTSASSVDWNSVTNPAGIAGAIPGKASQVEASRANPGEVYAVLSNGRRSINKRLYGSTNFGLPSSGSVSWQEINLVSGDPIDEVELVKSHASGIYAATRTAIFHKPASSSAFAKVYDSGGSTAIVGFAVSSATLGYIALVDSAGVYSFLETDWAAGLTDLSSNLPPHAPVQVRTSSCPILGGQCPLEIELVGSDPADATGKTVYIAGSSTNAQAFKSTDGGRTWNSGWDNECNSSSSGCAGYGFTDGYPRGDVIRFRGVAASGDESRHVFISRVAFDNDNPTSGWNMVPGLSSTISPSGSSGPAITQSTNANDPALDIDPNDTTKLYIATDLAIGQITHDPATGFASPSGSEMSNARGIDGLVVNDLAYYEISSTNKVLWIVAKSGAAFATGYDPTDPTSVASAGGWVFPIYPGGDGAPPTAVAIDPNDKALALIGNGKVYRNPTADGSTSLADVASNWTRVFDPNDSAFSGSGKPLESVRSERSYSTDLKWQSASGCDRIYHSVANTDTGLEGGIFYSDDKGLTWSADVLNGSAPLLKMPVNALLVNDNFVWAAAGDRDQRSSEAGILARVSLCGSSAWWKPSHSDPLFTNIQSSYVTDIDGISTPGSATTSGVAYIATETEVIKGELLNGSSCSTTGFACWQFSDVTPSSAYDRFSSVVIEPGNPDHVWVAYGNCIQESSDGGASWSTFGGSCVDNHEDIKVLVYDDLIAGTSSGAFAYSADADGDGVIDNLDAFPNDASETKDSDADGVGDNGDAFPNDASETLDTDSDGTGNNTDLDDDGDGYSDEQEAIDGTNPLSRFSCKSGCFSFDVDQSSSMGALTDGLLVIRHLFDFSGDTLVADATDTSATRSVASDISSYLTDAKTELDIDGSGDVGALTDGLLLIRYLFDFRGESLINNAIDAKATRKTAAEIEAYIEARVSVP